MLIVNFEPLLLYLKNKSVLITSHSPIDLDGFASSVVLELLLKEVNHKSKTEILFPEISKTTIDFLDRFSAKFPDFKYKALNEVINQKYDTILILDSNNLELVKEIEELTQYIPFIFIDHHLNLQKNYKMNLESYNIINESYTSTAEIIFEMVEFYKYNLPSVYKQLLASAITTDSLFLKNSNNRTLISLYRLLKDEIQYQDLLQLLHTPIDFSERIAKIKGLQRVQLTRIDKWLIGISHASSFSASIASMLVNIGFDVSIVYSKEKTGFRVTTRANPSLCQETGLHLGKILNRISREGGGHKCAASLNTSIDIENILQELLRMIKEILIKKQVL